VIQSTIAAARRRRWAILHVLVLAATAGQARAEEAEELREEAHLSARMTLQERPFAFLTDPSTPSAGVASMSYAFGLGSGIAADRPIPVNLAASNGSHSISLAYGATYRLAPFVGATFAENPGAPSTVAATVTGGLEYQLLRPGAPLRVSLSAAGVHEGASDASGFSALAAASLEQGAVRLAANVRADKLFAANRDAVDVITMLGASYRVVSVLRMGAEYVGQDLEEAFGDDAEGGARHALGPSVALDLDGGRYQLAVAPLFGLGARSPGALVRAALALNF
jgi:hypothetical protein